MLDYGNMNVSVVIPTYNRSERIMTAVQSVLNQTHAVFEVLVVDDGSTDDTKELFQEAHAKVRYLRQDNKGVSSARNLGIQKAKGDWIAFLDSDDEWLPNKIEEQVQCLEQTATEVCFTGIASENGNEGNGFRQVCPEFAKGGFFSKATPLEFLWKSEKHPMVQTMLIHRQRLLDLGAFDETLAVAEDTALFYKIVLSAGFSYVNSTLVQLTRQRDAHGLSDDPDPRKAMERYRCYLRVQSELHWRVLSRDKKVARHVGKRVGYFAGRCAEFECALGNTAGCRRLAMFAVLLSPPSKGQLRSALLFIFPKMMGQVYRKKWSLSQSVASSPSLDPVVGAPD